MKPTPSTCPRLLAVLSMALASSRPRAIVAVPLHHEASRHHHYSINTSATSTDGVALIGAHGIASGQLVVPTSPSWLEVAAAREISAQLLAATGANLTVVPEAGAVKGRPSLYVGRTEAAAALAAGGRLLLELKPEGYSVFVASPGAGFLLGDDSCNSSWPRKVTDNSECRRGSLFGAFALLRTLGFEWLWPGAGGQATPDLRRRGVHLAATLRLEDAPELSLRRYRPIYSNSGEVYGRYARRVPWLINHTLIGQLARAESEWLLRAGMGSHDTPSWGQAFSSWWGEWGANGSLGHHPEWFALLPPYTSVNPSATARRGPWMHGGIQETAGVKMCVSNAGLHAQIAAGYVAGSPGVSACEDDGDQGFCTCARCRAWDSGPTQGPNSSCFNHTHQNWHHEPTACRGQYSDRYARFWDAVAAVLARQHPDAQPPIVTGYAYDNYRNPPLSYTMQGNVMVGLVVDVFGSNRTYDDEEKAIWMGWFKRGAKRMFWRPNIGGRSGVGPFQRSAAMIGTLSWLGSHGLAATDMDSLDNHWAQSGWTYFATARSQWHPTTYDHDSALKRYCDVGFGPQAGPVAAEYLSFWEAWSSGSGSASRIARGYTAPLLAQAEAILTRLSATCGGYRGCAPKAAFWASGLQHARLTNAAERARNSSVPCFIDRACSVGGGFLPASLALLRFRRQIAPTFAVNVLEQSMKEVGAGDVTGIGTAAEVEPLLLPHFAPEVQMCVNNWAFAFDPLDVGESSSPPWFSSRESTRNGGANGTRWKRQSVGLPWNLTTVGQGWAAAHGGAAYMGVAWYRTVFQTELIGRNASKFVLVANISGSAQAWLNGLPLKKSAGPAHHPVEGGAVAYDVTHEINGKALEYQRLAIRVDGAQSPSAGLVSQVFVLGSMPATPVTTR